MEARGCFELDRESHAYLSDPGSSLESLVVIVIQFPFPVPAKEVPGNPQNSIGQSLPPAPMPRKAYTVSPSFIPPSHYRLDFTLLIHSFCCTDLLAA